MEYEEFTELLLKHRQQACNETKRQIRWEICEELLGIQDLIDACKDDAMAEKLQRRIDRIRKILEV